MVEMTPKERYGRKFPEQTWVTIQGRYEKGEGVRALAKEYGVGPSTISNRAKKYGWMEHGELRHEALEEARSDVKSEFKESYKELAKAAIGNHFKLNRYVQQLVLRFAQTVDANSKIDDVSKRKNINREIYQLNVLSQTMKTAIDGERLALGMDKIVLDDSEDGFSKFVDAVNKMRDGKLKRDAEKASLAAELIEARDNAKEEFENNDPQTMKLIDADVERLEGI